MRVVFLTQTSELGPSSRHRVYQYLEFLKKQGILCTVSPAIPSTHFSKVYSAQSPINKLPYFFLGLLRRFVDLAGTSQSDIIFLQKEVLPQAYPLIEKLIRELHRKLVFDFDDAIFLLPPGKRSFLYNLRYKNSVPKILSMSDYIIAGNEYLRQYALRFNTNVMVIPTSIDTEKYHVRERKKREKISIGWIGSTTTTLYLDQLKNVLRTLAKGYKFYLNVIGTAGYGIEGVETVSKSWRLEREVFDLQDFDIGVAPLENDGWTLGKCGCKVLQYMAVGIPVVASRVGVHGEIIDDGVNGFLADSEEEWIDKLSLLIEDENLRRRLGIMGRKTVEDRYSVKVNGPRLLEILDKVNKM